MTTLQAPSLSSGRRFGDVKIVATKLYCSPRHIYRMADSGRMPRPIKLGSLVRWDLDELDRWIESGCPSVRSMKGASR
jgi:excisionase family DNA binding protein